MERPPHGICLPTRNVRVIDGDTLECDFLGGRITLRLLECWAPEIGEEPGRQAAEFLRTLLEDRNDLSVYVPIEGAVRRMLSFSRLLGRLFVGQRDVSVILVEKNHATRTKPEPGVPLP